MLEYVVRRNNDDYSYFLLDTTTQEAILDTGREVAVGFSWDGSHAVMHKHGSPENVRQWRNASAGRYTQAGLDDNLFVIAGQLPTGQINQIINNSGWLASYLQVEGVLELMQSQPTARVFWLVSREGWYGWTAENP